MHLAKVQLVRQEHMVEQAGAERLGGESALLVYNGPLTGITLWAVEMAQRVKAFAEYP